MYVVLRDMPLRDLHIVLPADLSNQILTRTATSPHSTARRYFVVHTRCKWISYTVCAPRRYSTIPQAYPAARALKPSPEGEGLNLPRLGQSRRAWQDHADYDNRDQPASCGRKREQIRGLGMILK